MPQAFSNCTFASATKHTLMYAVVEAPQGAKSLNNYGCLYQEAALCVWKVVFTVTAVQTDFNRCLASRKEECGVRKKQNCYQLQLKNKIKMQRQIHTKKMYIHLEKKQKNRTPPIEK